MKIIQITPCVPLTPAKYRLRDAALREVVDSIVTRTASLHYNVEVSLVFLITTYSISYVLIGSTICLCRGTRCSADYDQCAELPKSLKD